MRDIPMFTTDNGVAGLILREIPYKKSAYIQIHCAENLAQLIEECVSFCKAVGAQKIYASGHDQLEEYPFYTSVWKLSASTEVIRDGGCALFPVTEEVLDSWREIYNRHMKDVPNAAYISRTDTDKLLQEQQCYFIHDRGRLLGIGAVSGEMITVVISVVRGQGERVLRTLADAITSQTVSLEVASANTRALRLYERVGFLKTQELSRWFCVYSQ